MSRHASNNIFSKHGRYLNDLKQLAIELNDGQIEKPKPSSKFEGLKSDYQEEMKKIADLTESLGHKKDLLDKIKVKAEIHDCVNACKSILTKMETSGKKKEKTVIMKYVNTYRAELEIYEGKLRNLLPENRAIDKQKIKFEERKQRRRYRDKHKSRDIEMKEIAIPIEEDSVQVQIFEKHVADEYANQEELLIRINEGLDELKDLANDMHKKINQQAPMLEKVEDDIDKQIVTLKSLNGRLHKILEDSGGTIKWVCVLILVIIILAVLGAMFGFLNT